MEPGASGRDRRLGVRSRRRDDHGVERCLEELFPPGHPGPNPEPLPDCRQDRGRKVADRVEREPIRELAQVGQVHDLGYEPAADDPDAERRAAPERMLHWPLPS